MSWVERYFAGQPILVAALMIVGISIVAYIDWATGVELRVYPLYFIPLSLGAWFVGRRAAVLGSILAVAMWYLANRTAGMVYSEVYVWYVNLAAQGAAFLSVSLLIARMHELLKHEQALARTDMLTGLYNSRAFYEQTEPVLALCRRHARPATLAYLDIDNFKCVNDLLGHDRGDEALRVVGRVIRAELRAVDMAARIGGDEFVVCLPETDESQAAVLLERIRAVLEVALDSDPRCPVSASIGAVTWSPVPATLSEMMRSADAVMYEVKRTGKNSVRIMRMGAADPAMTKKQM